MNTSTSSATTDPVDTIQDPYLLHTRSGHVLWLRLNRPQKRNPLSGQMISSIKTALDSAAADESVRVIVLASAGPVFSAGHDLREMPSGKRDDEQLENQRRLLQSCAEMMMTLQNIGTPVIACVQGTATAAGCQLVASCDLAVASEQAQFCLPGVNIGSFCTTPLVGVGRKIGRNHALELALTGDLFSALDALRFGLVNKVVSASELEAQTEALAQKIAAKSRLGVSAGKRAFYQQMDMPLAAAYEFATEKMIEGQSSEDAEEGTRAFFEKRDPHWQGL
jgi:enoyl-CoA hydratase/carnithine racemase